MTTDAQNIGQITTQPELQEEAPEEVSSLLGASSTKSDKLGFHHLIPLFVVFVMAVASMAISTAAGFDITFLFICKFFGTDESKCFRDPNIGNVVANYTSVMTFWRGLVALIVNTYVGYVSDKIGRKPVLLVSIIMSSLSRVLTWYIVFHMQRPNTYWWLALPTIIDFLGGSTPVVIMMTISYITDYIGDTARRAKMLAVQDGLLYISLASGPILGSLMLKHISLQKLYMATAIIGVLAALLTTLFLTESLSATYRQRNSEIKYNLLKTIKPLLFTHIEDRRSKTNTVLLLLCTLVGTEFTMSFFVVLMLYPKRRFGWSAIETGYLLSIMSSTGTVCLLVGFPILYSLLARNWGISQTGVDSVDTVLFRVSLLLSASGYLLFGKANTSSKFYMAGALEASAAIGRPLYKSCLLKYVPHGQAGSFLAAFALLTSISDMFVPSLLAKLLAWSYSWRPSLIFEVVSSVFAGVFLLALLIRPDNTA